MLFHDDPWHTSGQGEPVWITAAVRKPSEKSVDQGLGVTSCIILCPASYSTLTATEIEGF